MKAILTNRVNEILNNWKSQNYDGNLKSAVWFAVRDAGLDNVKFGCWVCRLFGINHITDLTQSQAVKLYSKIN